MQKKLREKYAKITKLKAQLKADWHVFSLTSHRFDWNLLVETNYTVISKKGKLLVALSYRSTAAWRSRLAPQCCHVARQVGRVAVGGAYSEAMRECPVLRPRDRLHERHDCRPPSKAFSEVLIGVRPGSGRGGFWIDKTKDIERK